MLKKGTVPNLMVVGGKNEVVATDGTEREGCSLKTQKGRVGTPRSEGQFGTVE